MSKKMPRRAKKLPGHVKPGEIVLAPYKGSVPWPSLIKNVYKAKAKATFNYLPLAPEPCQQNIFTKNLKAFSPFDNKKTATERQAEDVPAAISQLVSTPPPAQRSVGHPASRKKSAAAVKLSSNTGIARKRKSQLYDTSTSTAKAEVNVSEKRKSKPESGQQATSSVRRGATRARVPVQSGTPVTKKKMDVPEELSAIEQLNVDHPDQEHSMIRRGARVFGQYAQAFYPAIICTDDGLSRYSICFIEDGITKPVPNDSVFLLSKIVPGVTTMISPSPDDLGPNVVGREIEVVAVPDSKNGEEWKEGKFKVRDTETGEESTVLWTQFYFRKQDADALKLKETDTPLVKESNIVFESRTSHRSRAAFNHSVAELPKALTTTIPLARRSRPSTGKKEDLDKTQLASTSRDVLNETPVNEEKLDELTGSTVADSTSGTEAGEKNAVTDIENVPAITASGRSLDQHEDEKASDSEKKPEDSVPSTSHLSHKHALEPTAAAQEEAPNHEEATLVNFIGYLLPNGNVIAPDGIHREFEWQSEPSEAAQTDDELRQWFEVGSVDSPLEDNSCDPAVMTASGSEDVDVSDSDSLFEALITGRCPVAIPAHRVFNNWKFVVSCSTCHTGQPRFSKGDILGLIKLSGGTVYNEVRDFGDELVFLIADTFSRARTYLMALSLSIQCVHVNWIKESIEQGSILDYKKYELPAGAALGPDGQLQEKPLKGTLMKGKKIWVYRSENTELPNEDFVSFWPSIVANLGAKVVRDEKVPEGESELAEWIIAAGIDIVLTDPYCEWEILQAAETRASATVVGTEWVIEAIITEKCPDPRSARYRHDAMPMP